MPNPSLAEKIKRLLPGEEFKRIRLAIMEAATAGTSAAIRVKNQIDQENRLKDGKLQDGILNFPDSTTAELDQFVWTINYQIFQPGFISLPVLAHDPDFPRPDVFTGDETGTIKYYPGTIDSEGNGQFPDIPEGEVILREVIRNTDGSNDSTPGNGNGNGKYVSLNDTGTQVVKSYLGSEPLAGSLRDSFYPDANGVFRKARVDYHGVYSTVEGVGATDWSKIVTINVAGGQLRYFVMLEFAGVSPAMEKGMVWIQFETDGSGNLTVNLLKVFGEINPVKLKMVKLDANTYGVFVHHNEAGAFFKFRPQFSFGSSTVYTYHHQDGRAALPAGTQYEFELHGDLAEILAAITTLESDLTDLEGNVLAIETQVDDHEDRITDLEGRAPLHLAYANQAAMLADQDNQLEGYAYWDGSSEWRKLSTSTANISDYREIGGGGGGGADTNAVHYNAADGKTDSEKAQARGNIGSTSMAVQVVTSTGTINDLVKTSNFILFTGSAPILTGIEAGEEGEEITLMYLGSGSLTISPVTGSSSSNQMRFGNVLSSGGIQRIKYYSKWMSEGSEFSRSLDTNDIYRLLPTLLGTSSYIGFTGVTLGVRAISGTASATKYVRLHNTSNVEGFGINNLNQVFLSQTFYVGNPSGLGDTYNAIKAIAGGASASLIALRVDNSLGTRLLESFCDGSLRHARSVAFDRSIRRDEQRLHYLISITTSGSINNQSLTAGIFNYRFTAATSITGFANGEIGRRITIHNDSGTSIDIPHEDAGSIAANRVKQIGGASLTIPDGGKAEFEYCTGSRWELISKNF